MTIIIIIIIIITITVTKFTKVVSALAKPYDYENRIDLAGVSPASGKSGEPITIITVALLIIGIYIDTYINVVAIIITSSAPIS
jgi:hypothetical protein